jgi:hypothetical protein
MTWNGRPNEALNEVLLVLPPNLKLPPLLLNDVSFTTFPNFVTDPAPLNMDNVFALYVCYLWYFVHFSLSREKRGKRKKWHIMSFTAFLILKLYIVDGHSTNSLLNYCFDDILSFHKQQMNVVQHITHNTVQCYIREIVSLLPMWEMSIGAVEWKQSNTETNLFMTVLFVIILGTIAILE